MCRNQGILPRPQIHAEEAEDYLNGLMKCYIGHSGGLTPAKMLVDAETIKLPAKAIDTTARIPHASSDFRVTGEHPLRGGPAATCLETIAVTGGTPEFAKGEVIFRENSHCDNVYLVASGHMGLDMHVQGCGDVRLLAVGEGELLGWTPLFGSAPMTATATALEATSALEFPGARLRELCESDHEIGYRLMRQAAQALSHRLIATRLQLLDLYPAPA